nr:hypothetical protein [Tanacetum cinerariifolium]
MEWEDVEDELILPYQAEGPPYPPPSTSTENIRLRRELEDVEIRNTLMRMGRERVERELYRLGALPYYWYERIVQARDDRARPPSGKALSTRSLPIRIKVFLISTSSNSLLNLMFSTRAVFYAALRARNPKISTAGLVPVDVEGRGLSVELFLALLPLLLVLPQDLPKGLLQAPPQDLPKGLPQAPSQDLAKGFLLAPSQDLPEGLLQTPNQTRQNWAARQQGSWARGLAMAIFLQEDMDSDTADMMAASKVPILKHEWHKHVVVWRNKSDLDTMSMDDLHNNLKVYEPEVKEMSSSSTSSKNMAFVSSSNNNSTNKPVNTTQAVNIALGVSTVGTQVNTANIENLSDAVIYAFLACQPSSP